MTDNKEEKRMILDNSNIKVDVSPSPLVIKLVLVLIGDHAKVTQYQKSLKECTSVTMFGKSGKVCITISNKWMVDSAVANHMKHNRNISRLSVT